MQGYWRLESDGTDSSANGYTLTTTSAPSYVSAQFGNGADFELGSSNFLSIANASCANLEIAQNKTYMCWIKPESIPGTNMYVMAKSDASITSLTGLRINATTGVPTFISSGLTPNELAADSGLSAGTWYFLAGVHDYTNSLLKIWVNGTKKQVSVSGTSTDTNGDFAIGRLGAYAGATVYYFDGIVDDAAVFNRALTDAEVTAIYSDTATPRISVIV